MSALCHDCGVDTTPCSGKRGCRHKGRWEYYMVKESVWRTVVSTDEDWSRYRILGLFRNEHFFLCIGCLEKRLGRALCADDFVGSAANNPDDPWNTPRLTERLRKVG
jgi:hypothetical protein